jgi:hypothetical protein
MKTAWSFLDANGVRRLVLGHERPCMLMSLINMECIKPQRSLEGHFGQYYTARKASCQIYNVRYTNNINMQQKPTDPRYQCCNSNYRRRGP